MGSQWDSGCQGAGRALSFSPAITWACSGTKTKTLGWDQEPWFPQIICPPEPVSSPDQVSVFPSVKWERMTSLTNLLGELSRMMNVKSFTQHLTDRAPSTELLPGTVKKTGIKIAAIKTSKATTDNPWIFFSSHSFWLSPLICYLILVVSTENNTWTCTWTCTLFSGYQ